MQTIEITGATGTGPYDVYVCDTTLTYCVLAGSGVNFPPNFLYTLVYPLDIVNSVIIKLIDSNGCEFLQLYNCPTPTPTPTPTLTPTPTNAQCNCIQFENPTAYPQFITYTQCDGTVFLGSINNGTTLYVCGKLPNAEDGVLFSVGIPCIDGACNPIPPPPSATPTITPTPTLTPTPAIFVPTCSVLYNTGSIPLSIYSYDVGTNTSTLLPVSSVTNLSDIAHTTNKMWVNSASNIREWDITLSPFTSSFNRVITLPTTIQPGLGAIDDTTLISVRNDLTPRKVVTIDITTSTGVFTDKFDMILGRNVSGDILLTTTNKVLITNSPAASSDRYITQHDYATGTVEFDILISPTINDPYGLFIDSGNIYIIDGISGTVYLINNVSPYNLTPVGNVQPFTNGASQLPSCLNTNFV
jgi:hypothetical protein